MEVDVETVVTEDEEAMLIWKATKKQVMSI
jgi:hypothetical protein